MSSLNIVGCFIINFSTTLSGNSYTMQNSQDNTALIRHPRVLALILSCYEHTKWAFAKKIGPQSHQKHFTADISLFGGRATKLAQEAF
jgi:hypothetical protein